MLRIAKLASATGVGLAIATILLSGSASSLAHARPTAAEDQPVVYSLVERWQDPPVESFFTRLEWPAGHVGGGIGFDRGTGTLYAVDRTERSIRVYRPDGGLDHVIGGPGGAGAGLVDPFDVEGLPEGLLVVSDAGDQRVKILRGDGFLARSWPVDEPRGLTAVRRGSTVAGTAIYVVARGRSAVRFFDIDGKASGDVPLAGVTGNPIDLAFRGDVRVTGGRPPVAPSFLIADPSSGALISAYQSQDPSAQIAEQGLPGVGAVGVWRRDWLSLPQELGGNLAIVAGVPGLGVSLRSPLTVGAMHNVPFDDVSAVDIAPDGTIHAAVAPYGLISLGKVGDFAARAEAAFGFLEHPERIAAGERLLVVDAPPEARLWTPGGSRGGTLPAPSDCAWRSPGRGESNGCRPIDVAAAGSRHYALMPYGSVREADVFGQGYVFDGYDTPPGSFRPVALDAAGERIALLDLLGQEVLLLGSDWREQARWSVSAGGFKGVMDLAVTEEHVYLANQQSSELEIWTADGALVKAVRITSGPVRVAAGPEGDAFVLTGAGWVFMYGPDGTPLGAWPAGAPKDRPADIDVGADGRVYIADPDGEIRVYARDPGAPAQLPPPASDKACAMVRDKGAEPREIWIGETVEVQLRVDGECPVERKTADVVLAIDHSGSMNGDKLAAAQNAAITFVALTDPLLTRVGVVAFDDQAELLQGLSTDRRTLVQRINSLTSDGGTDLVTALQASHDHVTGPDTRQGAGRVIVFMSDGRHTEEREGSNSLERMLPAIVDQLRRDNVQVYAIGLGADADAATLRKIAGDEAHYFFSPSAAELRDIYVQVARRIEAANLVATATLTDIVPDNMAFVPGSGQPIEPEPSADGRTLTWRLADVLEPGFLLSYRVRPQQVGYWPTNVQALLDYIDGLGHPGQLVFPVPHVRVLGPTPTPSDTPTPTIAPTDTPTPTPTPSRTPTAPPIPTVTPTPTPADIYLPLVIREKCDASRLHVILVLDTSTSMAEAFRPGDRPKIEALREAVRAFLAGSRLDRDTTTLVRFSGDAGVVASGSDRAALEQAVDGLALTPGTRIDLGLEVAHGLVPPAGRQPELRTVIVLLSDGAPTPGTRDAALAAAGALRESAVTLYTVAVGADADRALMAQIAGHPDRALVAEDGATLVRLYEQVAGRLAPCVPSWEDRTPHY